MLLHRPAANLMISAERPVAPAGAVPRSGSHRGAALSSARQHRAHRDLRHHPRHAPGRGLRAGQLGRRPGSDPHARPRRVRPRLLGLLALLAPLRLRVRRPHQRRHGWPTDGRRGPRGLRLPVRRRATADPARGPGADAGRSSNTPARYRHASPGVEFLRFRTDVYGGVRVVARNGQLWVEGGRRGGRLVPTGPDRFRFPRDNDTSVVFGRSAEGQPVAADERWLLRAGERLVGDGPEGGDGTGPAAAVQQRLRSGHAGGLPGSAAGQPGPAPDDQRSVSAGNVLGVRPGLHDGLLGLATPLTILVWVLSWGFGISAHHGFVRALPGLRSALPLGIRIHALLTAAAATWIALHLSRYGLIGIRTWLW